MARFWCLSAALALGFSSGPLSFLRLPEVRSSRPTRIGRQQVAQPPRGLALSSSTAAASPLRLAAEAEGRGAAPVVAAKPARRWRAWALGAVTAAVALLRPLPAFARAARRYASRSQESQAQWITLGALALLFLIAFANSRKEDNSEEERIKAEVSRLVRLKKEFEEQATQEGEEDLSDDSMAAALRAAQEKMSEDKSNTEGGEGEGSSDEEKADGAAEGGAADKDPGDDSSDKDKDKGDADPEKGDKDKK